MKKRNKAVSGSTEERGERVGKGNKRRGFSRQMFKEGTYEGFTGFCVWSDHMRFKSLPSTKGPHL